MMQSDAMTSEAAPAKTRRRDRSSAVGGGCRVLLIDDDAAYRIAMADAFADAGYEVITAADGRAGLAAFEVTHPDVVITGVMMPEVDGIEVVRHLAKAAPEVPVIAISVMPVYLEHCAVFGAARVLQKPFAPAEILETLKTLYADAA